MIYEDVFMTMGRRGGVLRHRFDGESEFGYNGRRLKPRKENPVCNDRYGRWVPGGDVQLHLEEYAQKVIDGELDYETAVRLTESLTDAVGKPCATKRDLLMVLARLREAHHAQS